MDKHDKSVAVVLCPLLTLYLIRSRLDFLTFEIAPPDVTSASTAGQCLTDVFTVSGQSNVVPNICGSNPRQHCIQSYVAYIMMWVN